MASGTEDDRRRAALAREGYTTLRGAVLFSLLLALVGALLGSVVLAIAGRMLMPALTDDLATVAGALVGGALGVLLGMAKVRRGNFEALEQVEDREWRRLLMRQHGK